MSTSRSQKSASGSSSYTLKSHSSAKFSLEKQSVHPRHDDQNRQSVPTASRATHHQLNSPAADTSVGILPQFVARDGQTSAVQLRSTTSRSSIRSTQRDPSSISSDSSTSGLYVDPDVVVSTVTNEQALENYAGAGDKYTHLTDPKMKQDPPRTPQVPPNPTGVGGGLRFPQDKGNRSQLGAQMRGFLEDRTDALQYHWANAYDQNIF